MGGRQPLCGTGVTSLIVVISRPAACRPRLADARQEPQRARDYLAELVRDFPDGDLADDALGQLADRALEEGGCQQALPYYRRLREEYSRTGWAAVATSAIVRCRQEGLNPP